MTTSNELKEKAEALLDAAYDYWEQMQKDAGRTSVVWVEDDNGRAVIFTRSEYRKQLMENVHKVGVPVLSFHTSEE